MTLLKNEKKTKKNKVFFINMNKKNNIPYNLVVS